MAINKAHAFVYYIMEQKIFERWHQYTDNWKIFLINRSSIFLNNFDYGNTAIGLIIW